VILMQLSACVASSSTARPSTAFYSLSESMVKHGTESLYTKVASHLPNEEYMECKMNEASSIMVVNTTDVYFTILG
jgi:hypothetical protein